ncbi:MAG: TonB-dependent receptor [Proteobacteria bacterium]|nr:TonB-dependent receptor [Pseudomonadota bacterium]
MTRTIRRFVRAGATSALALSLAITAQAQDEGAAADPAPQEDVEAIVVTGSHIKRKQAFDSVSPIDTVGQAEIQDIGIVNVADLVRNLTFNTGSEFQIDAFTQGGSGGTSQVNLRGLGLGSSLVLLNGRRQTVSSAIANAGDTFVDTNALLPLIAVERIETVKDGAAAIYGTEAVAGVVNFITRDRFEGLEISLNSQFTTRNEDDEHRDIDISAIAGVGNDRGHIMAALSYRDKNEIRTTDRPFRNNQDGKTLSTYGSPGSYISPLGVDLGNGVGQFVPDPDCPTPDAAGVLCLYDFGDNFTLVPEEQRLNIYTTGHYDLADWVTLRGEFGFARNEAQAGASPSFPALDFFQYVVPDTHPANPFGTPVLFRGRVVGDDGGEPGSNRAINSVDDVTYRGVIGLEGEFPDIGIEPVDAFLDTWSWELFYTFSTNRRDGVGSEQSASALVDALRGFGGPDCVQTPTQLPGTGDCFYFNPFASSITASPGDPEFNDPSVIPAMTARQGSKFETTLRTWDGILSGELFDLPWGSPAAAIGFQLRDESFDVARGRDSLNEDLVFNAGGPDADADRDVWAVFGELEIPVFDLDDISIWGDRFTVGDLSLTAAVRHENYERGIDSTDPKLGILWRMGDFFSLRTTWGTSFRAATLFQQEVEATAQNGRLDLLSGSFVFLAETAAPNPDLDPETADTVNAGFTLSPIDDLEIGFDYYYIKYEDLLTVEDGQALLDADFAAFLAGDPLNPNIIRDPITSSPIRIFAQRFNANEVVTDGIDLTLRYTFSPTDLITLGVHSEWSYVRRYDIKLGDGSPTIHAAGNRNDTNFARSIPEWRGNTTLSVFVGDFSANMIIRHISDYKDDENDNDRIDSWTTVDMQFNYQLPGFGQLDQGPLATFGIINIGNQAPPAVDTEPGFDTKVHDPRGRILYFRVTQRF